MIIRSRIQAIGSDKFDAFHRIIHLDNNTYFGKGLWVRCEQDVVCNRSCNRYRSKAYPFQEEEKKQIPIS